MYRTSETSVRAMIHPVLTAEVSAYKDQFGSNFTSAIPTNVFGPNDNL